MFCLGVVGLGKFGTPSEDDMTGGVSMEDELIVGLFVWLEMVDEEVLISASSVGGCDNDESDSEAIID